MRVKITGIKTEKWNDKNTGLPTGRKTIYFQSLNASDDIDGFETGNYTIGAKSPLYSAPIVVNGVYNIFTKGGVYNGTPYTAISEILDEKYQPLKA